MFVDDIMQSEEEKDDMITLNAYHDAQRLASEGKYYDAFRMYLHADD